MQQVIAPTAGLECAQIARGLVSEKGFRHVSFDKEVYSNVSEVFTISGFIPSRLQNRIKGMQMSGIGEW